MVEVEGYVFPEELYYTDDHIWVRRETDGTLTLGFDDLASKLIRTITFVMLAGEGTPLMSGRVFGTVESMKWIERLKSPISGSIKGSNTLLGTQPRLINQDPYGAGWFIRATPTGKLNEELSKLAHEESIAQWARKEIERRSKKP